MEICVWTESRCRQRRSWSEVNIELLCNLSNQSLKAYTKLALYVIMENVLLHNSQSRNVNVQIFAHGYKPFQTAHYKINKMLNKQQ